MQTLLNSKSAHVQAAVLSETRAPDRRKIADRIQALALAKGCQAQQVPGSLSPSAVQVELGLPGGLRVTVSLEAKSCQPNVHVLSWHMPTNVKLQLNPDIWGNAVNTFHFQKATDVAYGTVELLERLELRMSQALDGSLYRQPKETPGLQAKHD